MDQKPNLEKVVDLDGKEYLADSGKLLYIAPSKLEWVMSQPELRKRVVLRRAIIYFTHNEN